MQLRAYINSGNANNYTFGNFSDDEVFNHVTYQFLAKTYFYISVFAVHYYKLYFTVTTGRLTWLVIRYICNATMHIFN
jgi:hypothetical protein